MNMKPETVAHMMRLLEKYTPEDIELCMAKQPSVALPTMPPMSAALHALAEHKAQMFIFEQNKMDMAEEAKKIILGGITMTTLVNTFNIKESNKDAIAGQMAYALCNTVIKGWMEIEPFIEDSILTEYQKAAMMDMPLEQFISMKEQAGEELPEIGQEEAATIFPDKSIKVTDETPHEPTQEEKEEFFEEGSTDPMKRKITEEEQKDFNKNLGRGITVEQPIKTDPNASFGSVIGSN